MQLIHWNTFSWKYHIGVLEETLHLFRQFLVLFVIGNAAVLLISCCESRHLLWNLMYDTFNEYQTWSGVMSHLSLYHQRIIVGVKPGHIDFKSLSKSLILSTNSPLDLAAVLETWLLFFECVSARVWTFKQFLGRVQNLCVCAPAEAVLMVSHCFAVFGTSARCLYLTPELAGLHEVCDVRHSKCTVTTV